MDMDAASHSDLVKVVAKRPVAVLADYKWGGDQKECCC